MRSAPCPAWHGGRRRPRLRCGHGAGRSPRRRQDVARRVGRPRAGPQVRARRPGRCARRGRDPWAPPHLRRRAARPHRAGHRRGGIDESRCAAGRDRQGGLRLPGRPGAALLEVLDPAQNHTFRDHYLDLDLDLSDVVFLATANVIENIPSALLDRMELVTIDGYTEDDKVAIARDYLLPRQAERAALTERRGHRHRCRAAKDRRGLHPRAGGSAVRTAAGQGAAQGHHQAGGRPTRRSPSTSRISLTTWAVRGSRRNLRNAPRCPA